jgi:resuscitation-promoting factor RpfB
LRVAVRGIALVLALGSGLVSPAHTNKSAIPHIATTTTTTTTVKVVAKAPVAPPPLVSPAVMARWKRVAWCETHGQWYRNMPVADGGLGIHRASWNEAGGQRFAPAPHLATPEQQVYVAIRIQTNAGVGGYVPDQDGNCRAW